MVTVKIFCVSKLISNIKISIFIDWNGFIVHRKILFRFYGQLYVQLLLEKYLPIKLKLFW